MIKLSKVEEKQRETQSADGKPPVKKQSSGELRLLRKVILALIYSVITAS